MTKEEYKLKLIEEAEQIDKQHTRPKPLTKSEKNLKEVLRILEYKETPEEIVEEPIEKKSDDEWDVKIGDEIHFFDPTLSYEISGYRPIDKYHALDFDPKVFTVAADTYRKCGKYTSYIPNTFIWINHWTEEFNRCKNGYTVGKYTLTGENYFFLNYYRLLSVIKGDNQEEVREEDFPGFFAKQYEYFHYIDIARKTGHDGLAFKARGVGFSEIAASNLACDYTFHKASYNIVTAFAEPYVTTTLQKTWQELDFLNTCTEGAFKHLRMKVDTNMVKRASKIDKDRNESGWMSTIEGVTADVPRKLRGNRCYSVYFEEAGSNPVLVDTYVQSRALVSLLGRRVGSRFVFGTGGDSGQALAGLTKMFNNPEEYSILPYKNTYSKTQDVQFTGFFIPSYTLWFGTNDNPGYDHRGVVDEARAKAYYEKQWSVISDPSLLLKDKAEYCFTPEDAFALEGSNVFNSEKLAELKVLISSGMLPKPERMVLNWLIDKETNTLDKNSVPEYRFDSNGKILVTELPMKDASGNSINNLYLIGIDAIDSDSNTSTGLTDVSKYCIIVFRRLIGLKPPKIVALYKERPKDIRDAHNTALKLAQFYNAKILFEATRVSIFLHFAELGKTSFFLRRPKAVTAISAKNKRLYGCPADQNTIMHQIELILNYVNDYCDLIDFEEVVTELITYSYDNKRKFDIVAAFGITLLANEDMIGKIPREHVEEKKMLNIGYYTNEYGQKVWGEIPDKLPGPSTMTYGWFGE